MAINRTAIEIVKQSYDYPNHAWANRYEADLGKRKLLNILRYLANPDRYARPKNRVYRSNRPEVNNLWNLY